ncbi:MAG: DUF1796 family putative cysteine peptidase [Nostoc sp.]
MEDNITSYYPISLCHNCIPAHYLEVFGLRTQSLPFDWLLSPSYLSIDYAVELIDTNFKYFLSNLEYNHEGIVVSGCFPNVKFWHHDLLRNSSNYGDRLENSEANQILAFERRAKRFMNLISSKNVFFINVFQNRHARLYKEATFFWNSVDRLTQLLERKKVTFQLMIVIYDDADFDLDETVKPRCLHHNVYIRKFVRNTRINPYFGCENEFRKILQEFFPLVMQKNKIHQQTSQFFKAEKFVKIV